MGEAALAHDHRRMDLNMAGRGHSRQPRVAHSRRLQVFTQVGVGFDKPLAVFAADQWLVEPVAVVVHQNSGGDVSARVSGVRVDVLADLCGPGSVT
ncbi:hypothetical protein JJ691_80840 [Kutzneria sp. CA-103260]|nr:hypothetical protein JJ691_80840 [Kutzneria sp. CA-103260]